MIKSIIVDDDASARETLAELLSQYIPDVQVLGQAGSVDTAVTLIADMNPDLVFLDIEMPYGSGFDVLTRIGQVDFAVIFVTAYGQYAIDAFRYSASDYLLKPVRISDLRDAVEKVKTRVNRNEAKERLKVLADHLSSEKPARPKIVLPDSEGFIVVEIKTIIRCEAVGNYTQFYFQDGKKQLVSRKLKEYEEMLEREGFFRIHQSHLINLAHVRRYIRGRGGEVEMADNAQLPVSRQKKDEFLQKFM